jgi:pimeloyl-ACP methyl ester carboxylesterase
MYRRRQSHGHHGDWPNDSSVIWQLVQPQISKFTQVCSYDRAGFGWSDAPNEPRSRLNIANELERLLTRASVPSPYVLVGHDFGTLDLRVFTSRHRQQVAGMVFVDSVHSDIHNRPPFNIAAQSTLANFYYHLMPSMCHLECREFSAGVARISPYPISRRNGLSWCLK